MAEDEKADDVPGVKKLDEAGARIKKKFFLQRALREKLLDDDISVEALPVRAPRRRRAGPVTHSVGMDYDARDPVIVLDPDPTDPITTMDWDTSDGVH